MTLFVRFGALTALSALAACTTVASTDAIDGDSLIAAASVYTPTYDDGESVAMDVAETDVAGGGLVGFMGFDDGTVRAVRVRFSEDESSIFLSVDGGPEREFAMDDSEEGYRGASDEDGSLYAYVYERAMNYIGYYDYGEEEEEDGIGGYGYYGLQTAPTDLPSGTAEYDGFIYMDGNTAYAYGSLNAEVDFDDNSITGDIEGDYYNFSERRIEESEPDTSFTGDISGEVAGSFVAMSADVSGTDFSGNIGFLGGFYNEAEVVSGGAAGTIDGNTMGGEFIMSTGEGEGQIPF